MVNQKTPQTLAPTADPVLMLARIVSVNAEMQSLALEGLALGQDAILKRIERLERILAERRDPPA